MPNSIAGTGSSGIAHQNLLLSPIYLSGAGNINLIEMHSLWGAGDSGLYFSSTMSSTLDKAYYIRNAVRYIYPTYFAYHTGAAESIRCLAR